MYIYVDVSSAVHAKAGLKRYAENLVRELSPLLGEQLRLFQNSLGRRGPLPGWQGAPPKGVRLGYKPWRALVLFGQIAHLPLDHLIPQAALFHATEHLLPPFFKIPTVLTVHDLIFERYPEYHKKMNYLYLRAAMPLYCQRATAIIAVSEATKRDLCTFYKIPSSKIAVIPEAAAPHFYPQSREKIAAARKRYKLPSRYILTVGTIEPRKNLIRLLEACTPLFHKGLLDGLAIAGSKGWLYKEFFDHLRRFPYRKKIFILGFVPEKDLPALYSGALVTVQPSLCEGFGLPVLEAMACGSPVCASNNSSFPEVGGQAALYFDPENVAEISKTLQRVLANEGLRREMRSKGLARAASFSWARTAQETVSLYNKILEQNSKGGKSAP
ncbi:MAG: glycosyltransferase family 4 protein [Anaerolineae bacterium]|nr:glycosyltransferase family 4 protein [Anaerolineae bacterium]